MSRSRSSQTGSPRQAQAQQAESVARSAAQEVRIIGGQWKRTPLPVPASAGLRPTPSRVRETLFNWLGQDLGGWRVLDAFAGTGALGLEAASRGADEVVLLEREPALARNLERIVNKLKATQVKVVQSDAVNWMQQPRHAAQFDLVLLDPPFHDDLFWQALQGAANCVPRDGWIYLESPQPLADLPGADQHVSLIAKLALHRHGQAGAVHFHLFRHVDAGAA